MLSKKVKTDIAMSNTEHGKFKGLEQIHQKARAENQEAADTAETPGAVDDVYNELIHMRKMNKVLG